MDLNGLFRSTFAKRRGLMVTRYFELNPNGTNSLSKDQKMCIVFIHLRFRIDGFVAIVKNHRFFRFQRIKA